MAYWINTDEARIQPNVDGIADQVRKRKRSVASLVGHVRRPHGDGERMNRAFRERARNPGRTQRDAEPFLDLARRRDDIFETATYAPGRQLPSGSASAVAKRRKD
ncbi:hypothetical protein [Minwuia thermotolerans]|uniref:hypothetical protein n=1 Tax=Minwuia thermotolerans TaxID=2056226 RepID=UPI0013DE039F|nr:hypothetical protein [Minwuia thermotolerans]